MAEPESLDEWMPLGSGLFLKTTVYESKYEQNDYSKKEFVVTWLWCSNCRRFTRLPAGEQYIQHCPKCDDLGQNGTEESWEPDEPRDTRGV